MQRSEIINQNRGRKKKKMSGRMNMGVVGVAVVVVVVIASVLIDGTAAENYTVGGDLNWAIPPNTTAYSTWASSITFRVGDTLVFNFTTGSHDVAVVNKNDYDNCNSSHTITLLTTGPASYELNSTGDHHFFCAVSNHCSLGQKFSISISASSTGSPPPPPSSGATPSPPPPTAKASPSPTSPPNNSAPPLAAATFSALIFTAAAMALITW